MSNQRLDLGARLQGSQPFLEIQSFNSDNFTFDANSQVNLADSLTVDNLTINGTFTNAGGGEIGGSSATYTTSITTPKIIFTDNLSEGLTIESSDGADYITFDSTNGTEHIDILKDVNTGGNKITMGTNGSRGIIQYANIKNSTIDNTNTLSANTTGTSSAWNSNMRFDLVNHYTGQLMDSVNFNGSEDFVSISAQYIDESSSASHRFVLQNTETGHTSANLQTRIEFLNQYQSGMVRSDNKVVEQVASSGQFATVVYDTGHASNFSELRLAVDYNNDIPSFNNFVFWDTQRDGERFMKLVNLSTTYDGTTAQKQYPTSIHFGNGGDFSDATVGNTFAKIKANWRADGQGQLKLLARRTASSSAQECGLLITDNAGSNAIQQNQQTNNMIISGQQIDGISDIKYFNGCALGNSSHLGNGLEYKDSGGSVISGASTGYDNTLELKLDGDSLQTSGSGLSAKLNSTGGLENSTGLKIKLKSGGGLSTDADGIFISSVSDSDKIEDADADTFIKVEASADNDTIDFNTAGNNVMKIKSNGETVFGGNVSGVNTDNATLTITQASRSGNTGIKHYYLQLGGDESTLNSKVCLGFGKVRSGSDLDVPPANIRFVETQTSDATAGYLALGCRESYGLYTYEDTTMVIKQGRVGIGTISPEAPLYIEDTWNNLLRLKGDGTNENEMRFMSGSNYCAIAVNSSTTEAITFTHSSYPFVGIRTNTPSAPLTVNDYQSFSTSQLGGYAYIGGPTPPFSAIPNPSGTVGRIGVHVQWNVKAYIYLLASDTRIKEQFEEVNDNEALDIINKLEIVKYHYKDTDKRNELKTIGFKAQQVKEILPNAVKITTDVIPDIFELIENPVWEDNKLIYDVDLSGNEYTGKVKFYVIENEKEEEKLLQYNEGGFVFEKQYDKVFVFGREVNDFHNLDKKTIYAVGMSAIQELSRKVDLLETQNELLQTENNSLLVRTQEAEDKISSLESLINDLSRRVAINETTLHGLIN